MYETQSHKFYMFATHSISTHVLNRTPKSQKARSVPGRGLPYETDGGARRLA